jgi:16S rRNA C967 or C1407 C5-methylase (RsmB/RsmF family)
VTRTETLDVVEAFLHDHPEAALAPFDHPLNGGPTDGTLTLLPADTHGDAMFIARFVKG